MVLSSGRFRKSFQKKLIDTHKRFICLVEKERKIRLRFGSIPVCNFFCTIKFTNKDSFFYLAGQVEQDDC